MLVNLLYRSLLLAAGVLLVHWLVSRFGPATAFLLWSGFTALAAITGAVLLRTSTVGKVTWKNQAAAWLLPWGARLNRGMLWPLPVVTWLVWIALGGLAIFVLGPQPDGAPQGPSLWLRGLVLTTWIVNGAGLMFLLGTVVQHHSWHSPAARRLQMAGAGLVLLLVLSGALYALGQPVLAVCLAGLPPLILAILFGGFAVVVVTLGRRARWH